MSYYKLYTYQLPPLAHLKHAYDFNSICSDGDTRHNDSVST